METRGRCRRRLATRRVEDSRKIGRAMLYKRRQNQRKALQIVDTLQVIDTENEGSAAEMHPSLPQPVSKSDGVLLGDGKSTLGNSKILLNKASSSPPDVAECNTPPTGCLDEKSKDLPLLKPRHTRKCRKAKIVICYDESGSDAGEETEMTTKCIKETLQVSPPRGTEDVERQQQTPAVPLELETLTSYSGRKKTEPNSISGTYIELSDSSASEENGYNDENTVKLDHGIKVQGCNKNDTVSVVRSRRSMGKRKERLHAWYPCTVCFKKLHRTEVTRHPLLHVCVCRSCKQSYCQSDFEKDEDGSEDLCRWCAKGRDLVCCGQCEKVFCRECITQNLGEGELLRIIDPKVDWCCFVCNPTVLRPFVVRLLRAREEIYRFRYSDDQKSAAQLS